MPLTREERCNLAGRIIDAMREQYEAAGVSRRFDNSYRYFAQDADDEELLEVEAKWCKQT